MQARPPSKYHLKDLYQEIAFYDRKIAYCRNFEKFDSEEERSLAVGKLARKRTTLVESAAEMTSAGVHCDPGQLPASLKNADSPAINKVASSA
jgi:hypothetical protein